MDITQLMVILFYVCIACAAMLVIVSMIVFFALVIPSIRNEKKEPSPTPIPAAPAIQPQNAVDGAERTVVLNAPAPADLSATTATLPVLNTPRFEIVKKVVCCDTQEMID